MNVREELRARIAEPRPVLLDGALGTELERRGVRAGLPLWTTHALLEAPDAVREIHAAYARAGAEILTAGTFRTQRRTLARGGVEPGRAAELTETAVALAREAGDGVWIAGSAPPLEDCYRPDLVPRPSVTAREHVEHAENLRRAGVDCILIETMNTVREAEAAAAAAAGVGLPLLASFVAGDGATLLSGEPLDSALDAVARHEPIAVLVNCIPPSAVAACLPSLHASGLPFGVYANLGAPVAGGRTEACSPREFARHAAGWIEAGASVVGGCCGTQPEHIAAIRTTIG